MKKILLLLALLVINYSCTKETDDSVASLDFTGEWKLVKMTGSWTGSVATGAEMEWQETYLINKDETFTKTRVLGDIIKTVSGTYTFVEEGLLDESESGVVIYIDFIHDVDNDLIASCYSNSTKENLYFDSNNKLISTWIACDGSGLEYAKEK